MAIQKTDINPATGKQYAVNPATGHWDDSYWAEVVEPKLKSQYGGGSSGGGGTSEEYIKQLIETLTKEVVPKAIEFDSEAARKAAEEEWGPYYEEILEDYLAQVSVGKEREKEDLTTYLESLGIRETREKENFDEIVKALDLKEVRSAEDLAVALEGYGITGARTEEDLVTHNLGYIPKVWVYTAYNASSTYRRRIPIITADGQGYDYYITSSVVHVKRPAYGNNLFKIIIFTRSPLP